MYLQVLWDIHLFRACLLHSPPSVRQSSPELACEAHCVSEPGFKFIAHFLLRLPERSVYRSMSKEPRSILFRLADFILHSLLFPS